MTTAPSVFLSLFPLLEKKPSPLPSSLPAPCLLQTPHMSVERVWCGIRRGGGLSLTPPFPFYTYIYIHLPNQNQTTERKRQIAETTIDSIPAQTRTEPNRTGTRMYVFFSSFSKTTAPHRKEIESPPVPIPIRLKNPGPQQRPSEAGHAGKKLIHDIRPPCPFPFPPKKFSFFQTSKNPRNPQTNACTTDLNLKPSPTQKS